MKKKVFLFLAVAAVLAVSGNMAIWGQSGPQTADGYIDRGTGYLDSGDVDRAIADFTQAIRLNPNLGHAYFFRAHAYSMKDALDYDRPIADVIQAIRLTPNNDQFKIFLAGLYYFRGESYLGKNADRAIADFTEVIRLPRNRYTTDAYFYRGMVYRNDKGDLDRTIADFEQLLLIDPNYENNGIKIREVLESFKQQRGR